MNMLIKRKKILILLTDSGGGHRASAQALHDILIEQNSNLDVKLVNVYREVLSSLDWVKRIFNVSAEESAAASLDLLAIAFPSIATCY